MASALRRMFNITTADDFIVPLTLIENESNPVAVDLTGCTIAARVISKNYNQAYCDEVSILSNTPGSNWALGIIIINIPALITQQIEQHINGQCNGWLEIEVTFSDRIVSWYQAVTITQGHITNLGG